MNHPRWKGWASSGGSPRSSGGDPSSTNRRGLPARSARCRCHYAGAAAAASPLRSLTRRNGLVIARSRPRHRGWVCWADPPDPPVPTRRGDVMAVASPTSPTRRAPGLPGVEPPVPRRDDRALVRGPRRRRRRVLRRGLRRLPAPYSPTVPAGDPLTPPGGDFLLGTDEIGRDLLSRVLIGMQSSWWGAMVVIASGVVVGGGIGLVAGAAGASSTRCSCGSPTCSWRCRARSSRWRWWRRWGRRTATRFSASRSCGGRSTPHRPGRGPQAAGVAPPRGRSPGRRRAGAVVLGTCCRGPCPPHRHREPRRQRSGADARRPVVPRARGAGARRARGHDRAGMSYIFEFVVDPDHAGGRRVRDRHGRQLRGRRPPRPHSRPLTKLLTKPTRRPSGLGVRGSPRVGIGGRPPAPQPADRQHASCNRR